MRIPCLPQVEKLPEIVGIIMALLGVLEYDIWARRGFVMGGCMAGKVVLVSSLVEVSSAQGIAWVTA